MIYAISNLKGDKLEFQCQNRNEASKQLFDHLSLLVDIVRFVRIGETIEMDYRIDDSQDIKTKAYSIHSPKGGYPEGMVYAIKE